MCEVARLSIYHAFKNVRNQSNLKPLMLANCAFASKFVASIRSRSLEGQFGTIRLNAHRIEELAALVISRFAPSIKAGSFDTVAFETALAERIRNLEMFLAPESFGLRDVLAAIQEIEVDGNGNNISAWLGQWGEDTSFVELGRKARELRAEGAADFVNEPDLEAEIQAQRFQAGVDRDPDLCG